MTEEEHYDAAGEALVEWVGKHKETVDGPLLCSLMLDQAIDLCTFALGIDATMKAVDEIMREKIRDQKRNENEQN